MKLQTILILFFVTVIGGSCSAVKTANARDENNTAVYVNGREIKVLEDDRTNTYIAGLGSKIVQAIPQEYNPDKKNLSFVILNDNKSIAFSYPRVGNVYVHRGMIQENKLTEGQLAGIIAHEVAHCLLGHIVTSNTSHDQRREWELEADELGTKILINAGYNPMEFIIFLIDSSYSYPEKENNPDANHPTSSMRINKLQRLVIPASKNHSSIRNTQEFVELQQHLKTLPW